MVDFRTTLVIPEGERAEITAVILAVSSFSG